MAYTRVMAIKGIVKMNILASFTHLHVVLSLYDLEHKRCFDDY